MASVNRRILPGFGLSLGFAISYLVLLVLAPMTALFAKAASLDPSAFWAAVMSDRARAAYALTFGASLLAAAIDVALGLAIAWVLVRYRFAGRWALDALVDLPLALPTAVAGLVYSGLYAKTGWFGKWLAPLGVNVAYTRLGVVLVLVFVSLPLVVRTVQPVLDEIEPEIEEASASLGASRLQTFTGVLLPALTPSLLTGFALSLARGIGEYGSVVFISGNMPYKTEIAPLLIVARLEEYAYAEATAIAVTLLASSLALLGVVNLIERASRRHDA